MRGFLMLAILLVAALCFVPVADASYTHADNAQAIVAMVSQADLGGDLAASEIVSEVAKAEEKVELELDNAVACRGRILRGVARGVGWLGRGVGRAFGARGSC